jgi:hypothetical protein
MGRKTKKSNVIVCLIVEQQDSELLLAHEAHSSEFSLLQSWEAHRR